MIDLDFFYGMNISYSEFRAFLLETDKDFVPSLCSRINVLEYYAKLREKAQIIMCLHNRKLVGLIAFYCNDLENKTAYVTFIAVVSEYRGKKIASLLLEKASNLSLQKGMQKIKIETNNDIAYKCYLKNGFKLIDTTYLSKYDLNRYLLEKEL